jgi:hypothetical protein
VQEAWDRLGQEAFEFVILELTAEEVERDYIGRVGTFNSHLTRGVVRFAPTVKPETIAKLDAIGEQAGESRGEVLDRLVEREYKRLHLEVN